MLTPKFSICKITYFGKFAVNFLSKDFGKFHVLVSEIYRKFSSINAEICIILNVAPHFVCFYGVIILDMSQNFASSWLQTIKCRKFKKTCLLVVFFDIHP